MILYIALIAFADICIIAFNVVCNPLGLSVRTILIAALILPFALIAIDGLAATVVRWCLPAKWFDYSSRFQAVSKRECRIYELLGVKLWKDHVVELGMFTKFSKKSVENPEDRAYIERFILECNYGALCHLAGIAGGYFLIFCYPPSFAPYFVIPAATVNAVLSFLPFMILRYNLPRLHRIRAILEKREALHAKRDS